ncbi:MAG: cupin domain-containing protein [Pigmentiphaga sp.]
MGESGNDNLLRVVRANDRKTQIPAGGDGHYEFAPLSHSDGRAAANAIIVQFNEQAIVSKEVFHGGHEMFFVLSGVVELLFGARTIRLEKGDFVEFPGLVRHQIRGVEPNTSILVVVTDQDA